jgi:hypothetical protein
VALLTSRLLSFLLNRSAIACLAYNVSLWLMVKLLASFSILEHRDSGIECIPARPRSIATLMLGSKTYFYHLIKLISFHDLIY